ncbi:MAG: NAD(P)H-hydrate dehydratase [Thermodesulfobacteriota bacterium]|nr:NAD(P)H-hydrate dehydratase [Thermodesulfobacteriota bacterium]
MKLATSTQMQGLDQTAIKEIGIPGVVLMENAGLGTVDQMEKKFGPVLEKSVIIFIGPGNNGGDGLVIGRHVLQRGGFPYLVYLVTPETLGGDAGINAAVCNTIDLPNMVVLQENDLAQLLGQIKKLHFAHPVHCLVDALFGTGLKRNLEGRFASVVRLINKLSHEHKWPVTAVDIPSGLSADTGETLDCSVQADLTVTYGLAKPGHYMHGGPTIGRLAVIDIGIPRQVIEAASLPGKVLDRETGKLLLPRRAPTHKGSFGHLLILAGSEGKTGAAILSGQAALHSGCGLVTLAVPTELNTIFETSLPEAMTVPLPSSAKIFSMADYDLIIKLLVGKDALVLGPGIGTDPDTGTLVRRLYSELHLPIIVDADALNLLALAPESIASAGGQRILSPHPGEMARLTGCSTAEIQAGRLHAANWLSDVKIDNDHEIVTILKGAGTVVCSNKGEWAINSSGNNGMATGGMGDVLSGLIGGLAVQGYSPYDAAGIGVYVHGLAADLLAEKQPHGYLASDVAAALPSAALKMGQCPIST